MLGQTSGANVSHARACWLPIDLHISRRANWKILVQILAVPKLVGEWKLWFVRGLGHECQFHDRKQIFVPWSKLVTWLAHGNPTLDRGIVETKIIGNWCPIGIQIGIQRSSVDLGLEAAFPFGHGLTYTTFEPLSSKLLVEILQLVYHIQCFCRKIPHNFVHLYAHLNTVSSSFKHLMLDFRAPLWHQVPNLSAPRSSRGSPTRSRRTQNAKRPPVWPWRWEIPGKSQGKKWCRCPGGMGWNGGRIHERANGSNWWIYNDIFTYI